jgi:glycosyltransferase involved in cell wall biosynthesis
MDKKARLKIAFVSQPLFKIAFPKPQDSLGIWTYEVVRYLVKSCEVSIYARTSFRKQVECHEEVYYRYIPIFFDKLLLTVLERLPVFRNVKRPLFASNLYYLGYALQIANDLRKQKVDIVHVHNFSQFIPVIRALNPKVKIILHMHCDWLTQLEPNIIENRIERADLVISCSDYLTAKTSKCFPRYRERMKTIHNGVDVEHFSNDKRLVNHARALPKILFVGRVSPEKGVHVLLDAFGEVVKHYPQAKLEIVGANAVAPKELLVSLSDDPRVLNLASFYSQRSYISQLQNRLSPSVAAQVSFTGSVSKSKLVNHYRDADVLINPSFSEAFGMSLVEAMATEVPVVATRVGGMIEVIEKTEAGLLVEPGNASVLAEAILHLLSNEQLRKSMGKRGCQRVQELFSWEKIAEALLYQYKNLCFKSEE